MTFNILDPQTALRQSRFLEASAGTGKTYSIENLFVRLLMENSDIKLENILVVTFTKAAAQDLKSRIKKCLKDFCNRTKSHQQALQTALALEDAMYNFDQASIFTIHGFCFKALQEYAFEAGTAFNGEESSVHKQELIDVVKTFLATELNEKFISLAQLEIVLNNVQGKSIKLQESILQAILKGQEISPSATYEQAFNRFCAIVKQQAFSHLYEDLIKHAPQFLGICDRQGNIKKENLEKIEAFAALFNKEVTTKDFDRQLKDGLFVYHAFHSDNKKAKTNTSFSLNSFEELWKIVQQASDPLAIFANLAAGCQKKLYSYLEENHKLEFSYLLKKMHRSVLQTPLFKAKIREQYKVAIIDEFQDTDPLQWEIFRELFFESSSSTVVYLVGDPKQSIYSFRSADIYTYLAAENVMGKESKASLRINYRSQPSLIQALNTLFCEENTPGWIDLPRINSSLLYQPVLSSENRSDRQFKDTLGSIHFSIASAEKNDALETIEETSFFPFFIQEIKRLNILENVAFQEMAILVYDRFQAKRVMRALHLAGIPNILQKSGSLSQSAMLAALSELLQGLLYPKQESLFKAALGGRIIGLNCEELALVEDQALLAKAMEQALFLRNIWFEKGVGHFFQAFLNSSWGDEKRTVREKMLSFEGSANAFDELMSLVSLAMEYEFETYATPDEVIAYLDELLLLKDVDNEEMKIQQDVTQDAVNVLTIHASKGLEYGIVFALGLCNRSPVKETLISNPSNSLALGYFPTDSSEYALHLRECDAEKMRQLYVAMTRAKYRLYVPCIKGWKPAKQGAASAIELFLARHRQPSCNYEELYARLQGDVTHFLQSDKTISVATCEATKIEEINRAEEFNLIKPEPVIVPGKLLFCASFSSMSVQGAALQVIDSVPRDFESEHKTIHLLPAGRETGLLFHEMLQKLPFDIAESELQNFVEPFLRNTQYAPWSNIFIQALKNVTQCSFLRNLPNNSCFREMEFLFSTEEGFVNGVVDMVFVFENKYYVLDWKTNWLGSSSDSYSFDVMHQAMLANQYHLQGKLYAEALKRYVKPLDIRPFKELFGGVYYIFLRGLQPETNLGIYHFFPEGDDE